MADVAAIIDSVTLDEYSSIPLYQQLASSLRDKISSGELDVGAPLPTENALSQALGVGVSTVRSAYALLVKEGLVTRRPRRGSFVSSPELGRQLDGLYSFTSETRRLGKVPGTKVVSFKVIEPGAVVRKKLGLVPGEKVFEARRLRLADGSPIMTAMDVSSIVYQVYVSVVPSESVLTTLFLVTRNPIVIGLLSYLTASVPASSVIVYVRRFSSLGQLSLLKTIRRSKVIFPVLSAEPVATTLPLSSLIVKVNVLSSMTCAPIVPTSDPQVDEMGPLGVDDDVTWSYVTMDDTSLVQLSRCGADVDCN